MNYQFSCRKRVEITFKYLKFGVCGFPYVNVNFIRSLMLNLYDDNTAVKRLRMREFLSELSFELVQRLRKTIRLSAFIKP